MDRNKIKMPSVSPVIFSRSNDSSIPELVDNRVVLSTESDQAYGANNPLPVSVLSQLAISNDQQDAFARLRVSTPQTIFDSKQVYHNAEIVSGENQPSLFDNQGTAGSSTTYNPNRASTTLSVDAATVASRTRQTRMRFNYQPGKSQLIVLTFVAGQPSTGVTKEIGLFDDSNGIFLRQDASGLSLVVRGYMTGSPVDTVVQQASWNIDIMDGSGASGVSLDQTAAQILFFDFE